MPMREAISHGLGRRERDAAVVSCEERWLV